MITTILFDFYGVFLPDAFSDWLHKNDLKREGIYSELINQLDRSLITEEYFFEQLSQATGRVVTNEEIHRSNPQPEPRLIELIHSLKPHYTTALFSNASQKLRAKLDTLEMTPMFEKIIISSEIGHAKPSDEAFKIAIETLGVEPNEILFIDDNIRNVEAAGRHGIATIHHTSVDTTIRALRDQRIID